MTSYSRTLFGAAIILAALSTQTLAQITFANSGQNLATPTTRGIALGDIDGDGDLDAVTGTPGTADPNQTWFNDGSGNFTLGGTLGGFNFSGQGLRLEDMDGDGDLDCVISGGWHVLFNDGTGTFTDSGQPGTAGGRDIASGDFDGDGDIDFADQPFGSARVHLNDGNGIMTLTQTLGDAGSSLALDAADMDGDGDIDIVTFSGQGAKIFFNDGTGNFPTSLCPHSPTCANVNGGFAFGDIGDIDGDGDIDIYEMFRFSGVNRIWINDGAGSFTGGSGNGVFDNRRGAVDDFDGDGNADAVQLFSGVLRIRQSNGDGTFSNVTDLSVPVNPEAIKIGDLDGDGDGDLFVVGIGNAQVIMNTTPNATFPGSDEDIDLFVTAGTQLVEASGNPTDITSGDLLELTLSNPSGSLATAAPALVAQLIDGGNSPMSVPGFPNFWITPSQSIILLNGTDAAQFPFGPLQLQSPIPISFTIPSMVGLQFVAQGLAVTPMAQNGFFATSNAYFMRIN